MSRKELLIMIFIFIAALAVRLVFIPAPGYEQEVLNHKIWSQASVQYGAHNIYDKTWCNIPPVNVYILQGIGRFYQLLSPGSERNTYLLQALVKFPSMIADLAISLLIFMFIRKRFPFAIAALAMSAYAFNPAVILSSAYWGQMDAVGIMLAIMAMLALSGNRFAWAWALIALSVFALFQTAVLFPIIMLITWRKKGWREVLKYSGVSWCASVIILLPFLIYHQVDRVIDKVFFPAVAYPYVSFVAFNPWWLFRGGAGTWAMDTDKLMGSISYQAIGAILFVSFFALILRYIYLRDKDENALMFGSSMALFSFFMFTTQMHERYIMLPLVFLLMAAVNDRKFMPAYFILSFAAFFNIMLALFWAYPKNFPALPGLFKLMPTDIIICLINIALIIYFLFILTRGIRVKHAVQIAAVASIVVGLVFFLRPVRPVYLSDIAPYVKYQQSGELRFNSNSLGGPLTVNGFKFQKGIGTHAYSSLEYELGGKFRYLEGMAGVDAGSGDYNRIEAWVYADNKLVYNSGILQGWTDPKYFYIDIKGAKRLKLIISDGGDGVKNDYADWLNIRVIP